MQALRGYFGNSTVTLELSTAQPVCFETRRQAESALCHTAQREEVSPAAPAPPADPVRRPLPPSLSCPCAPVHATVPAPAVFGIPLALYPFNESNQGGDAVKR